MKNATFILVFSFLLSPFFLYAQEDQPQLEDSSFETGWRYNQNGANGLYTDYWTSYFRTLNSLYALDNDQGKASLTAYQDNKPKSGNFCIKLVSGFIPLGNDVFLPGLVGTLSPEYVEEYITEGREVVLTRDWYGFDTPHALEGYYKYKPVNGDSALIDIGFYDQNGEVFVEKLIIYDETPGDNGWTFFRIPIPEQYWDEGFSDIRVLFVASAGVDFYDMENCVGARGSTLWIDDIYLNYNWEGNGIKQNLFSSLHVNIFPNPAADVLQVELNEPFNGVVKVYNSLGGLVMEESVNSSLTQLNISTLAAGNYIYKMINGTTIFAQGKFIVAK